MQDHLAKLREMREQALLGGGADRVQQQHERGKLTARERLALLLDEGSFQELGALATHNISDFDMANRRYLGDGVVAGFGKINGRRVGVFAHDFTVFGGSFSEVQSNKWQGSWTSIRLIKSHGSCAFVMPTTFPRSRSWTAQAFCRA